VSSISSQAQVQKEVEEHKRMEAWFKARVQHYEVIAKENPAGYRLRVRLFGWLGYSYILFILLILLAVIGLIVYCMIALKEGNTVMLKLAFFAGLIAVAIARSLWVKMGDPEGTQISRQEAPTLWREVDAIAHAVGAAGPSQIRIDTELNAAAYQRARLGIFGFYENILLLGMPLLLSMTPDEARSVIAHEYGHFGGQHGKFGAWAYRVNQTWSQLGRNLNATGGRGAFLFIGFVKWFNPRFAALTFVLRRAHEYDADAAAGKVAGFPTAARALMRLSYLYNHIQDSFWKPYYDRVQTTPVPPANAFAGMPTAINVVTPSPHIQEKLSARLREPTDYDDTHPSLTDRLKAMGQLPTGNLAEIAESLSAPPAKSAAEEFFGPQLPVILKKVEDDHVAGIQEAWKREHAKQLERNQKLAALDAVENPTEAQEVNRAVLTYSVRGSEAAEPLLRAAMEKYPHDAASRFYLADILLDREDETGVTLMNEAMKLDRDCAGEGRKILAGYYYRKGQTEHVEALREEALVSYAQSNVAERAAATITIKEDLLPHDLPAEKIAEIKGKLTQVPGMNRAYLAKRILPGTGEVVYWFFVFPKRKLVEGTNFRAEFQHQVAQLPFGLKARIYAPDQEKPWQKKLERVPGSKIVDMKA